MTKKAIVTGASGHIGFHVASDLIEKGIEVALLIRKRNINTELLEEKGASILICDLLDPSSYADSIKGTDVFFHIASENTTDRSEEHTSELQSRFGISYAV